MRCDISYEQNKQAVEPDDNSNDRLRNIDDQFVFGFFGGFKKNTSREVVNIKELVELDEGNPLMSGVPVGELWLRS